MFCPTIGVHLKDAEKLAKLLFLGEAPTGHRFIVV